MQNLLGLVILGLVRSQCLPSNILSQQGFTPLQTPIDASQTACSNMIPSARTCVAEKSLDSVLNNNKAGGRDSGYDALTDIAKKYSTALNKTIKSCADLAANKTQLVTIDAQMILMNATLCKQLGDFAIAFAQAASQSSDSSAVERCYDWSTALSKQAICQVVSDRAANVTTSNDTNINVMASPGIADDAFTYCGFLTFATCFIAESTAFENLLARDPAANENLNRCQNLPVLISCLANSDICTESFKKEVFTQFFTPWGSRFVANTQKKASSAASALNSTMNYIVEADGISLLADKIKSLASKIIENSSDLSNVDNTQSTTTNTETFSSTNSAYLFLSFFMSLVALLIS